MPDHGAGVRARMVRSAAALIGERGFAGAGLREIVADSRAPRGSIYHHFPGGKEQLAEEAVALAAAAAAEPVESASDPAAALHACLDAWRHALVASDFRAGSTIAAAAGAPDGHEQARRAAQAAYARLTDAFATALRADGVRRKKAHRLATLAVAAIEGAVAVCRAHRDVGPLDAVGRELESAFGAARRR